MVEKVRCRIKYYLEALREICKWQYRADPIRDQITLTVRNQKQQMYYYK